MRFAIGCVGHSEFIARLVGISAKEQLLYTPQEFDLRGYVPTYLCSPHPVGLLHPARSVAPYVEGPENHLCDLSLVFPEGFNVSV